MRSVLGVTGTLALVAMIVSSPALAWGDDREVFQRAESTVNDDSTVSVKGYGQPGRLLDVSRQ